MEKKEIPNKITKNFMFEVYGNDFSEKALRLEINSLIRLLGGNVKKRVITENVFLLFVKKVGLPTGYTLSSDLQEKYLRIDRENVKNSL